MFQFFSFVLVKIFYQRSCIIVTIGTGIENTLRLKVLFLNFKLRITVMPKQRSNVFLLFKVCSGKWIFKNQFLVNLWNQTVAPNVRRRGSSLYLSRWIFIPLG